MNGSTLVLSGAARPGRLLTSRLLGSPLRALLDDLVTTLFPADCRLCNAPLLHAGFIPVCDVCLARLRPQAGTVCAGCGEVLDLDFGSSRFSNTISKEAPRCTACRLVPPLFDGLMSYAVYENEVRELIHLFKYESVRALARPLGVKLASVIAALPLSGEIDVIAVPLFPSKERQRGYNQAVLLAHEALAVLRKHPRPGLRLRESHRLLRRIRNTESQFALTPHSRRLNLRGAFAVAPGHVMTGRTVLLVDDIYTTGSTARECARVLRRAGAATVFVATLARAQTERAALWDAPREWSSMEQQQVQTFH